MRHSKRGTIASDSVASRESLDVSRSMATPAAQALHNNFRTSVKALRRDLVRAIHYLTAIHERKVHRALGFKDIADYAEAVAGFTRNQTETFLALGRRLGEYPEVRRALEVGELSWSKARLIVAQAPPEDERRWVDAAGRLGVRALESAMRSRTVEASSAASARDASAGSAPHPSGAPRPDPAPSAPFAKPSRSSKPTAGRDAPVGIQSADEKCHITYALSPEEYAKWSILQEGLRKQGLRMSNAQLLLRALEALACGSNTIDRGPRYLLAIHQCPDCGAAEIRNSRGRFRAPLALLEAATCDAVQESQDATRRTTIPPRIRRQVLARAGHRCQGEGCHHTNFLEIHHRVPAASGGRSDLKNLVTLCASCHRELHRRECEMRESARDPTA